MGGERVSGAQVNLFCRDVAAATRFYAALGLPVVFAAPDDDDPEHVELSAGGVRVGLTSIQAANRIAHLGVGTVAEVRSSELVLWCDDVDLTFAEALGAGAEMIAAPRPSPDGRLRYGWVRDPQGHQLKLVSPL